MGLDEAGITAGHIIAETDAAGATQREYIWLGDLPVAVVDNVAAAPVMYAVHTDHLGRPVVITREDSSWAWSALYKPFGETLALYAANTTMDFRFPGQWFQLESGLAYNWHRHYDATTGRYMQPDPLGFADGPGVYGYVRGNPLAWVDPSGLETTVVINNNGGGVYGWFAGTHAGLHVGSGEDQTLYDPNGNYNCSGCERGTRGSGDTFEGSNADLAPYVDYQKTDGSNVELFRFDTTPEQEQQIRSRIEAGCGGVLYCATCTSQMLSGIGPFSKLGGYSTPAGLANGLRSLKSQ